MAVKRVSPCDESQLQLLLYGDDDSDVFRVAAQHVESCETCQRRLTELAGDEQSWGDVRKLLGDENAPSHTPIEDASEVTSPCDSQVDDVQAAWLTKLGYLESPTHPELLGRLGRYEIERVIGTGGMGVVLKGFDTELNRPVAIKVLAPHLAHSGPARQRFSREGRAAAAVVHEHVVAIHNVESDGELPFLVMQYVAGESLQARLQRQGPLSTSEILRIAIQAAAGLAAAHEQGLVHRDIKPANVLLETGVDRALLTDFGLARAIDDASLTRTGVVAGTPHYMSPEQANGRPIDHRSDLFSLGAMMYFMATGHPPFRAERPMAVLHRICHHRHRPLREINSEIPDRLSDIVDRLLDKRPHRRPANAADVQQTLARLLSDVQQGRLRKRSILRHRPSRRIAALLAIAVITLVSTSWVANWFTKPVISVPTVTKTTDRVSPPVPSPSGPTYSGDSMGSLLSFGPSSEWEYGRETADLARQLDGLESQTPAGAGFLHRSPTAWYEDLETVQNNLSQLENLPYPNSVQDGDKR